MAAIYWDYTDSTSGTSTTTATGSGDTYSFYTTNSDTAATGELYRYYKVVRRYIVTGFDNWLRSHRADLTELINDKTNTGWKIDAWFSGDVEVVDPGIDIIEARAWWSKVTMSANATDRELLNEFIESLDEDARKALIAANHSQLSLFKSY